MPESESLSRTDLVNALLDEHLKKLQEYLGRKGYAGWYSVPDNAPIAVQIAMDKFITFKNIQEEINQFRGLDENKDDNTAKILSNYLGTYEDQLNPSLSKKMHDIFNEIKNSQIYHVNRMIAKLKDYSTPHLDKALKIELMELDLNPKAEVSGLMNRDMNRPENKKYTNLYIAYTKKNITDHIKDILQKGVKKENEGEEGALESAITDANNYYEQTKKELNVRRFSGISGAFWKAIDSILNTFKKSENKKSVMGIEGVKVSDSLHAHFTAIEKIRGNKTQQQEAEDKNQKSTVTVIQKKQ